MADTVHRNSPTSLTICLQANQAADITLLGMSVPSGTMTDLRAAQLIDAELLHNYGTVVSQWGVVLGLLTSLWGTYYALEFATCNASAKLAINVASLISYLNVGVLQSISFTSLGTASIGAGLTVASLPTFGFAVGIWPLVIYRVFRTINSYEKTTLLGLLASRARRIAACEQKLTIASLSPEKREHFERKKHVAEHQLAALYAVYARDNASLPEEFHEIDGKFDITKKIKAANTNMNNATAQTVSDALLKKQFAKFGNTLNLTVATVICAIGISLLAASLICPALLPAAVFFITVGVVCKAFVMCKILKPYAKRVINSICRLVSKGKDEDKDELLKQYLKQHVFTTQNDISSYSERQQLTLQAMSILSGASSFDVYLQEFNKQNPDSQSANKQLERDWSLVQHTLQKLHELNPGLKNRELNLATIHRFFSHKDISRHGSTSVTVSEKPESNSAG